MKRLAFCFDGTWNRLDAPNPTNVVLLAQSLEPVSDEGVTQIIHYDEGVGTDPLEKLRGGMLGMGLLDVMVNAFRFLIFNYEVGDEIYIFGFSRGAFTARSFAGLIGYVGIPQRRQAPRIAEAVRRYINRPKNEPASDDLRRFRHECAPDLCVDADDAAWRAANSTSGQTGSSPMLTIRYLGVWDTVGSLGVPKSLPWDAWINRKHAFHDCELSPQVESARHAVAVDEQRNSFAPTLWSNVDALNVARRALPDDDDAPYQQRWFPGDHGSVGGGGDDRRLSDEALDWVIRGARLQGLDFDRKPGSHLFSLRPDHKAPLTNMRAKPKLSLASKVMQMLPTSDRSPGPTRMDEVSDSTVSRWATPAAQLEGGKPWRPTTLSALASVLDEAATTATPGAVQAKANGGFVYEVQEGDSLGKIAERVGGGASRRSAIFAANRSVITHPDRIYPGQKLWIPDPV